MNNDLKDLEDALNTPNEDFLDRLKNSSAEPAMTENEANGLNEITANKQLRQDIDLITQRVANLPKSRERSLSITKLEEATMWLGMDLKRLGTTNPYPNSKDPNTGDKIDPTADGLKFSGLK